MNEEKKYVVYGDAMIYIKAGSPEDAIKKSRKLSCGKWEIMNEVAGEE